MQTYVVQAGDTLYGISKQFGVSVDEIKRENKLTSNSITVGQVLLIPSAETSTLYIVKAGDTLYSIAKKFNTTVDDLIKINNLTSTALSIGQQLRVGINDDSGSTDEGGTTIPYTVQAGDTLYSIAKKFNITLNDLVKTNNIKGTNLSIGQVLQIPQPTGSTGTGGEDIIIYLVKPGDSLYSIAKKYGLTVEKLMQLNNLTSTNLKVGQLLRLSFRDENLVPIGSSCYGEGYAEPSYVTYTVKRGDSLYSIAQRYGVSVDSIIKLNSLKSNNLTIGQVLKIKESE